MEIKHDSMKVSNICSELCWAEITSCEVIHRRMYLIDRKENSPRIPEWLGPDASITRTHKLILQVSEDPCKTRVVIDFSL